MFTAFYDLLSKRQAQIAKLAPVYLKLRPAAAVEQESEQTEEVWYFIKEEEEVVDAIPKA